MSFCSAFGALLRSRVVPTFGLVLALLWAPIWGQWHGIAHQVQQVVAVLDSSAVQAESAVPMAMDDDHELGSALCHVLDHLGHACALTAWPEVVSLALLPMAAAAWQRLVSHGQQLWWPAQARAPPHRI
ncbi:hypothetical protein B9Z52_15795 [Limnohabitans sp. Jir72]|nr:hypothetical protein B9Z52_15795 [Limnohabitans sp. Jir72]